MSNLCSTTIRIMSESEKLKKFGEDLKTWMQNNAPVIESDPERGLRPNWLGNIATQAGVLENPFMDRKGYSLRGNIDWIEAEDDIIRIDQSDAWSPNVTIWVAICDKVLGQDEYELLYQADEGGCGIYVTNDYDIADKWCVDNHEYLPEIVAELGDDTWEVPESALKKALQKLLKSSSDNMDKLEKEFWKSDYSEGCSIHKWRYADPTECN